MFKRIRFPRVGTSAEHIQTLYLMSEGIDISDIPFDVFKLIMEFAQPIHGKHIRHLRKSCRLMQHAVTSISYLEGGHKYVRWMKIHKSSYDLTIAMPRRLPKEVVVYSSTGGAGWLRDYFNEDIDTLIVDTTNRPIDYLYTYLHSLKYSIGRLILRTHCNFNGILDQPHRCVSVVQQGKQKVYVVDVQGEDLRGLEYPAYTWYIKLYQNG